MNTDTRGLVVPFPQPNQRLQPTPARNPQQRCRPASSPPLPKLGAEDSHPHARAIARRGSYEEAIELAREGHETVRRGYHDVNAGLQEIADYFASVGRTTEAEGFLEMIDNNLSIMDSIGQMLPAR